MTINGHLCIIKCKKIHFNGIFGFFIVYLRLCESLSFPEVLIPNKDSTSGIDSSNPEITYYGLSVQKNFMPKAKAKSMVKSGGVGVKSQFRRCQGESYTTNTFTKLFIPYYIMLLEQ
jgi:hypothetical protein